MVKIYLKEITSAAEDSDKIILATDPDREGEAIAAHLASEVPDEKLQRVEFTEITKAGVHEGMSNSRHLDKNMINAQKTRRIIDRLVGYKVSPVCLLYTSPSPRDVEESRMPSSA